MMEVVLPVAASMDCYEDMFKEITRKLYGEEGLPENMAEGGENGQGGPMRCPPDYDNEGNGDGHGGALTAFGLAALMQNGFPPHPGMLRMDHIQEAKYRGLQHGNPVPMPPGSGSAGDDKWIPSDEILQWTGSRIASYNPAQKLFRCADCECVGFLSRVAEHWLGTHANLRVFQCPQCPYSSAWARCVRMHLTRQHNITEPPNDSVTTLYKENPVLEEVTKFLQRLKTKVERDTATPQTKSPTPKQQFQPPPSTTRATSTPSNSENTTKRYCCGYCPYATDRRDLFTRHENIHREEKPFQCYVCQKQFNRADHVKKHFLRMHRDYPYDLNRIRRQPPKNASGMSYYHKYNNNPPAPGNNTQRTQDSQNHPHEGIVPPGMHQVPHHLNIPGGFTSNLGARISSNLQQQKQKSMHNGCNAKSHGSKTKKKGDKRYSCCYCAWSGVDNWCLKRHLNTHLKPFVCGLCDYKAARSERLATHVLKVHNKKACSRCSFMADDQAQLAIHLQEHQPQQNGGMLPFNHQPLGGLVKRESYDIDIFHQHNRSFIPSYKTKQQYGGAERLFHYMEVSDTSDPEENGPDYSDPLEDEEEPPPFMCVVCGCEFVDDISLEIHNSTYHRCKPSVVQSPEIYNEMLYRCTICEKSVLSQADMMEHMRAHSGLTHYCRAGDCSFTSSSRDLLLEHIVTVHNKLDSIVKCPHCSLTLSGDIHVENHRRQHHAVDVVCMLCDSSFRKCTGAKGNGISDDCNTGLDSNMNHHSLPINNNVEDDSLDGMSESKRSRKQRQPRKVISETSDSEIRVQRHTGFNRAFGRQWSLEGITQLQSKYAGIILNRRGLKCNWCRQEMATLPYHTPVSLALHRLWRHTGTKFQCEHCDKCFKHQYQVILHASRQHTNLHNSDMSSPSIETTLITPVPNLIKEPTNLLNLPVPGKTQSPFTSVHRDHVPDIQQHTNNKSSLYDDQHSSFPRLETLLTLPISVPATLYQLLPSSSSLS